MEDSDNVGSLELRNLIGIQKEMLDEHRRLRYLTVWLIVLTVLLLCTSCLAAAYAH
ncbi:MAG: hypothetical protein SA339_02660 [Methanomassiliicoccus sp.]|nr:hypothetical protein [Methanomassiliicoccus sp.]